MRTIITGASGFIGKNVLLKLKSKDETVAIFNKAKDLPGFITKHKLKHIFTASCDLTQPSQVSALAKKIGNHFDVCVYLAANGNPALSVEDPLFDVRSNVLALVNFLNNFRIKRFIFFSSGAIYDGCRGFVSPKTPIFPKIPYAISKFSAEQFVLFFKQQGIINEYVILRFFGAYGPYEPARKIYTKLVDTFYIHNKNIFTVRGNGKNFIDAMYIDDAVEAILRIIHSSKSNVTVDFSSGQPVTIDGLVKTAGRVFGKKKVHIIHQGKVPEYNRFFVSTEKMKEIFGFVPHISLEDGLIQFANFLARH